MGAMGVVISELFGKGPKPEGPLIRGRPVSPGVYTGTARVVQHAGEFNRLQRGDVLVTTSTSAAFNVVLPLLGAIVTDRGGQLSHAAIVAREYGIPAVVGTLKATGGIPDGARIRVDGTAGTVEIV
jgi:pyruvate,water dikinase